MRSIVPAASAALMILGGTGGALAQDVDVEIYGGAPYSYSYEYTESEPRAQYNYSADPPVVVVPARPRSCGEFRYWDGASCVDARRIPPDVR